MKVNVPEANIPRIVIIGGGFGGITLARALRKQAVQVVMFDKHNYHTFQPLLYQVASGGLEPDSIAFPIRKLFKKQRNFFFRMAEVQRVATESNTVYTTIGEIRYDCLVIATGSRTNFFGNSSLEAASHGMKNIPEALDLRSLILQNFERALLTSNLDKRDALMNFVVVGGGPTGVETAGALAELKRHILPKDYPELDLRKMDIHLMEAGDRLLAGMSDEASQNSRKGLEQMGVHVWTQTRVEDYDGETVRLSSGKSIPARTLIWAAGVMGETIQGTDRWMVRGNRLRVDQFNRLQDWENVFAIGDVAYMESDEAFPKGHPMVAQVAMQQGKLLASNLMSLQFGRKMKPFGYKDKGSMATIGRNKAVADIGKWKMRGRLAWLMWMGVHLFSLAGFRNKLVVFINWFWSYVTYDRGTRLIIRPFKGKQKATYQESPILSEPEPERVL